MRQHPDVSSAFYTSVQQLRKYFPCRFPVVVRTADVLYDGKTEVWALLGLRKIGRKRYYLLQVARAPIEQMLDGLVHEWAHAVVHNPEHPGRDFDIHDDAWGLAYAACYRLVVDKIVPTQEATDNDNE